LNMSIPEWVKKVGQYAEVARGRHLP